MTKEEYYKSQICAQAFRALVRENYRLRQVICGTDPESRKQGEEDREVFALVAKRARAITAECEQVEGTGEEKTGLRLIEYTAEDFAPDQMENEEDFELDQMETEFNMEDCIVAAVIAMAILALPIVLVMV